MSGMIPQPIAISTRNGHHAETAYAAALVRLCRGRTVQKATWDKLLKSDPPEWGDVASHIEASGGEHDPAKRFAMVGKFLTGIKPPRQERARAILDAFKAAWAGPDPGDEPEAGPKPFTLGFISSEELFSRDDPIDYLIEDMLAAGQPSGTGGPSKTLKTSLLVAKVVALSTGTPFLGRFDVPRPVRCGLISGESGRTVVTSTARHVLASHGLSTADANVFWSFSLPTLTNDEHLRIVQKEVRDQGLEYVALDPFYLTMGAGRVDAKDMFQMGPMLADFANACLDVGCTPEIAHHFVKNRESPFSAPDLNDLAFAGFNQFLAQWMLVAPRERYDAEVGLFKLTLGYGGRAGHCGELAVDIEVGRRAKGVDTRCWKVTIATPSEVIDAKKAAATAERRQRDQERDIAKNSRELQNLERAIETFRKQKAMTKSGLKTALGVDTDVAARLLYLLTENGTIEPTEVPVSTGMGRTKSVPGYALKVDGGGS
jgi:hypothetical protein